MKLFLNVRNRLFKGQPGRQYPLSRRDDLYQRVRRFMDYLNIDATQADETELRKRLEHVIEHYMELDQCQDIRPRAGLW